MPAEALSELSNNPQALMDPDTLKGLVGDVGPDRIPGRRLGRPTAALLGLRTALSSAISDVFMVAVVALAIGFVATALLKERPLRGREVASSVDSAGEEIEEAVA